MLIKIYRLANSGVRNPVSKLSFLLVAHVIAETRFLGDADGSQKPGF